MKLLAYFFLVCGLAFANPPTPFELLKISPHATPSEIREAFLSELLRCTDETSRQSLIQAFETIVQKRTQAEPTFFSNRPLNPDQLRQKALYALELDSASGLMRYYPVLLKNIQLYHQRFVESNSQLSSFADTVYFSGTEEEPMYYSVLRKLAVEYASAYLQLNLNYSDLLLMLQSIGNRIDRTWLSTLEKRRLRHEGRDPDRYSINYRSFKKVTADHPDYPVLCSMFDRLFLKAELSEFVDLILYEVFPTFDHSLTEKAFTIFRERFGSRRGWFQLFKHALSRQYDLNHFFSTLDTDNMTLLLVHWHGVQETEPPSSYDIARVAAATQKAIETNPDLKLKLLQYKRLARTLNLTSCWGWLDFIFRYWK